MPQIEVTHSSNEVMNVKKWVIALILGKMAATMKKLFILSVLFVAILGSHTILAANTAYSEAYEKAQHELELAVDKQNFKIAKQSIYELVPLMKDDIKYTKKAIGVEKKAKNDQALDNLKTKLARKMEIYDQLDHILHVSPAALRVEAKKAVALVEEFKKLSSWPKTT